MSLESGRKLGLISSVIAIVTPVAIIVATVFLIWSLIATTLSTVFGPNSSSSNFSAIFYGIIILLITVAAIAFAGVVLFIISMHHLAQYYKEPGIFKNALYAFIINITSIAVFAVIYVVLILTSITNTTHLNTSTIAMTPTPTFPPISGAITQIITAYIALLAIGIVLGIVSAVLYMRSFNKLAEKSGVDNFKTAGLLYLIGTALSIVGIGTLIVWIGWIFAAMGFNSLKPLPTTTIYNTSPIVPPSTVQKRYCRYCGTENDINALYCRFCGKQLQ